MHIQFLGGATTVTGSQFLLETEQARVLIDCGMFQGSPNESVRNRVPFGFEPSDIDAVVLTHAHLDHCGLLPLLVKGIPETTRQIALYTLLMVAISLLLWPVARMGLIYLGAAVGLGAVFIWQAYGLWRRGASEEASTQGAIKLYRYSISYLSLLFLAIAVDALVVSG